MLAKPLALQDVKVVQDLSRNVFVVVSNLLRVYSEIGGRPAAPEAREASQRSAIPVESAVRGSILTAISKV